jgi:peptidoglycan hydrolase-like protein with peptidoglycan-binding domain
MFAALVPASAAHARSKSLGDRVLYKGLHGHDVRVLQDFLTRAGFRTGIDGHFGRGTWRSVRRWERTSRLPVDGRVTRPDARALRATVEQGDDAEQASPGGASYVKVEKGTIGPDGAAIAPASAPEEVKAIIAAGNEIRDKPYKYGGGHGNWNDSGYDCSGSISYALHGAGLLDESLDSTGFESYGRAGRGTWVSIYANSGHAYMVVAGLRFDTSGARDRGGNRWTTESRSSSGYVVRHPANL